LDPDPFPLISSFFLFYLSYFPDAALLFLGMSSAGCVEGSSILIADDVDWKIYDRFQHYDFENDKSFQQGLQKPCWFLFLCSMV
jgi:hypothetical protein